MGRLRAHLNAGYTILGSPQGQERSGAYRVVAAVSYPLDYPDSFRDMLIAGMYRRQSDQRGQRNNIGVEIGLRHQLSSRIVLDAGLGTELYGPIDRAALLGTVGSLSDSDPCREDPPGGFFLYPARISPHAGRNIYRAS